MVSLSEKDRKYLIDPVTLRASAVAMRSSGFEIVAEQLEAAAAEIEGGNEAFAAIVEAKHGLETELKHSRSNHRNTLDVIAEWGDLLRELKDARPLILYGDEWVKRIKRALRMIV
ncbi:hypothetical protein LMG24238_06918 [Paraburkholderia sediminicola]|uniref:Uncharacterized protein n=1 Tax=Paraburkholderia sediminicola TaxID=458836 RepID=A0A6J5CQX6_9BURK|nr:hypothetical protein [Paraburkholderia sediminicola]CAB3742652.1 hypothetical protein LMG24238_06918 [Paraburkholderia sediminicola]